MPFVCPTMTVTQQFTLAIAPVTKTGKPAPVDGAPVWASSNEAVAKVVPDASGLTATVVAQGVGDYSISVTADADLGAGVKALADTATGSVTQGEAVGFGFTAGEVTEQP